MKRRSFHLTAICTGLLVMGTLGAATLPRVYAKAPASAQAEQVPAPAAASEKKKADAPTPCKTTKDCPDQHLCTKVGDHKECKPSAIKPPSSLVVT